MFQIYNKILIFPHGDFFLLKEFIQWQSIFSALIQIYTVYGVDPAQLLYDMLSYLNKKMNFRFLKIPAGKFFALGKNLRGDFDLCLGIFSRSL